MSPTMTKRKTPRWLEAARSAPQAFTRGEKPDWVERVLLRAGFGPPAFAAEALAEGRVLISGKPALQGIVLVRPSDQVTLDGEAVPFAPPTLALMFHKPKGLVVSAVDQGGQGTVFDKLLPLLPADLQRYGWHAIGRLDRDTTGLLLFTNDERLVEHATKPETHLPKRYVAAVGSTVTEEKLEPLRKGIELDDGPTRPAGAVARGTDAVVLTISEGRNHQVKRMLGAVGLPVLGLHREAIGGLVLDVPVGGWRPLSTPEIQKALGFEAARPLPRPVDPESAPA
jgi:23S rRNA pseudouridine2605 synthase/16S rRNA pseudouridine516 synthase